MRVFPLSVFVKQSKNTINIFTLRSALGCTVVCSQSRPYLQYYYISRTGHASSTCCAVSFSFIQYKQFLCSRHASCTALLLYPQVDGGEEAVPAMLPPRTRPCVYLLLQMMQLLRRSAISSFHQDNSSRFSSFQRPATMLALNMSSLTLPVLHLGNGSEVRLVARLSTSHTHDPSALTHMYMYMWSDNVSVSTSAVHPIILANDEEAHVTSIADSP